jgi:TonB family protein
MHSRARIGLFLAFCASVGAHGAAYASLSVEHRTRLRSNQVSEMNFELPPLPTALPEPPRNEPQPARAPTVVAHASQLAAKTNAPTPSPTPTPAPVTAAPALDLSGVTLSNDTGTGFAMPLGDGGALHGAIGVGAPRVQAVTTGPTPPSSPKPPALVDASDLSERPKPPALTGLLRENYPDEARQRGLRGSASVRARIDADGVIRSARLLSESSAGFGSACRRTVLGSHWSAPRDKNGSAVATEIVYTCHFEVDQ